MQIKLKLPAFVGRAIERRLADSAIQPGTVVEPPAVLALTRRTLLYFKAEACVGCDQLDMFIGRLAASSGLDLRVIDARRGELSEQGYGGQLLLDKTGELQRQYRVRVFPTLVLTDERGHVERVQVGGKTDDEGFIRGALGLA